MGNDRTDRRAESCRVSYTEFHAGKVDRRRRGSVEQSVQFCVYSRRTGGHDGGMLCGLYPYRRKGEGAPYPALSVPCCFSGSAGNVNKRICELDLSPSDGRHAQSVLCAAYHSTGLRCGIVPVQRAGDERRAEGSGLDDPVGASHGMAAQYHPGGSAPADLSCGDGSGGVEEVVQSTEKAGPGRHCRLCRRDACSGWDIDLAVRRRLPEGEAESCAGSCRI